MIVLLVFVPFKPFKPQKTSCPLGILPAREYREWFVLSPVIAPAHIWPDCSLGSTRVKRFVKG